MATRTIAVDYLARVEGEGALDVKLDGDRVESIRLNIFEPPRFFEGLLRGRDFREAPDITARICGICPVAYQTSAVNAMEAAVAAEPSPQIQALRRLMYCGEWIQSHALHVYMLHAPDFLGYASAMALAKDAPDTVARGLELKKAGNALMALVGGREVHPINYRVGGFYRAPAKRDLDALTDQLKRARDIAADTVRWVAGFDFPELEQPYTFVSLRAPDRYPMEGGRVVSSHGLDIPVAAYPDHVEETQVPHSTAKHAHLVDSGQPYLVGPLARLALNARRLTPGARHALAVSGLDLPCRNPYRSIIARSVEILFACEEALRLIAAYAPPDPPAVPLEPRAATGHGASEAPRGLLYHRYEIGDDGLIRDAVIVPPTSQNQAMIEADVKAFVERNTHLDDAALQWRCEQTIRNYDPCISCATHFLTMRVERT
jgi:coenzyme F420-reducing hydrogenase alpha subunit